MDAPSGTWRSLFSGTDIDAENLVREVALNAVSKVLMLQFFSDQIPKVVIAKDAVVVKEDGLGFTGIIPFPPELGGYLQSQWMIWFPMFLSEFGLPGPSDSLYPRSTPTGERIGELANYFRIDEHVCLLARRFGGCPDGRIIGIHGAKEDLISKLRDSGVIHVLVWREEHLIEATKNGQEVTVEMAKDFAGSGCMKLISLEEAEKLVLDSFARKSESIREIFKLKYPFEVDSWSSNHPQFQA